MTNATQASGIGNSTAPVTVTAASKLTESYRITSQVDGGKQLAAIANPKLGVELFTIGNDGTIWNFYPDPNSDTGYSSCDTGLKGTMLAVGLDANGRINLFSDGVSKLPNWRYVYYVSEINPGQWTKSKFIDWDYGCVEYLRVDQIADHLFVTVGVNTISPGKSPQWFTKCCDLSTTLQFFELVPTLTTYRKPFDFSCSGVSAKTAIFTHVCYFQECDTLIGTQKIRNRYARPNPESRCRHLRTYVDGKGRCHNYLIDRTGAVFAMVDRDASTFEWQPLATSVTQFNRIEACADASGAIHLFLLGDDHRIYHMQPSAEQNGGYLQPAPIFADVVNFAVAADGHGSIDLFAAGTAHNTVTHLFLEQESGNWQTQALETQTNGKMECYKAYSTDLTFWDAEGMPLVNKQVEIKTSEKDRLTVKGHTYFVDASQSVRVMTNPLGRISISQEADALAAPSLVATVEGTTVAIQSNAAIHEQLKSLDGSAMLSAKDANGNPILKEPYRASAGEIAKAIKQCMEIPGAALRDNASLPLLKGPRMGRLATQFAGEAGDLGLIDHAASPDSHWQLSFADGSASFRHLTPEEATAVLAAPVDSLGIGLPSWLEDIGDFVQQVLQGIANVVHVTVSKVGDAMQATIQFVVDGVTYLFNATVRLVEQLFDLVETIFAEVKIGFQQLCEWLGEVFGWDDILRTQAAISYNMNEMLKFLVLSADGVQRTIDGGLNRVARELVEWLGKAREAVGVATTIGGFEQDRSQTSPLFELAVSGNFVFNWIADNAVAVQSSPSPVLDPQVNDAIQEFIGKLKTYFDDPEIKDSFEQAGKYFETLGSDPG